MAAFIFDLPTTNAESFEFSLVWLLPDGSDWPWADYSAIDYGLHDQKGCKVLSLALGDGITVDQATNTITFRAPTDFRLCKGTYGHGCVLTSASTGSKIQQFTGAVTVTEGYAR